MDGEEGRRGEELDYLVKSIAVQYVFYVGSPGVSLK